jgi:hypothetical protein
MEPQARHPNGTLHLPDTPLRAAAVTRVAAFKTGGAGSQPRAEPRPAASRQPGNAASAPRPAPRGRPS